MHNTNNMKQQYYHFEPIRQWPQFIYDTMQEIESLKQKSNGTVTTEIYNKTLEVAVFMQRITNNETLNKTIC